MPVDSGRIRGQALLGCLIEKSPKCPEPVHNLAKSNWVFYSSNPLFMLHLDCVARLYTLVLNYMLLK